MEAAAERLVYLLNDRRQLLDCFIIDFFTERHWEKLAPSWRAAFEGCSFEEACRFLLPLPHGSKEQGRTQTIVWPLSLLAYVAAARSLSLPRSRQDYKPSCPATAHSGNKHKVEEHASSRVAVHREVWEGACPEVEVTPPPHLLARHVKPKKRHELCYLSETVAALARQTDSRLVVDVGSGQGHLSRCLAFQHGLNVTSIEAVGCHQERAVRYDRQAAFGMRKEVTKAAKAKQESLQSKVDHVELKCGKLQHITAVLYPNTTAEDFTREVLSGERKDLLLCAEQAPQTSVSNSLMKQKAAEQNCLHVDRSCHHPNTGATASSTGPQSEDSLVLVGLHTCGDLGPTMLRVFASCPQARGLVSVGCCYMKITTAADQLHPVAELPSQPLPGEAGSPPPLVKEIPSSPPQLWKEPSLLPHPGEVLSAPPHPGEVPSPPPHPGEVPSPPPHPGEIPSPPPPPVEVPSPSPHPGEVPSTPPHPGEIPSPSLYPVEVLPDPPPASHPLGYPLSQLVSSLEGHELSYRAREMSCHAMENYTTRILGDPEHLKVHCHRAVMETILKKHNMQRVCVKLSSKQSKLPFKGYAEAVLKSVHLEDDLIMEELQPMLVQWPKVALFFIARLVLAPCVESLLLLDRAIYLRERGASVGLVPLFEPTLSPRNTAIVARKNSMDTFDHKTIQ